MNGLSWQVQSADTRASYSEWEAYLILSIGLQSRCQIHVQPLHRLV